MKLEEITIGKMLEPKGSFIIPLYQRAYAWDKNNWEVFLEDIREQISMGSEYSYGNLLLQQIDKETYEIIDGQQRLTTIIIFMRAVINVLVEKGDDQTTINNLVEDYLYRRGMKKLRPVEYDRTYFDNVIINNLQMNPENKSQKNYKEALDFFTNKLHTMKKEEIHKLKDFIADTTVNKIIIDGKGEAALMFELQNNRGKDLTNLEKLKSYLMYQVKSLSKDTEIDSNLEEIDGYFKKLYGYAAEMDEISEDSLLIYHCNSYLDIAYGYRNLDDIKEAYKKETSEKKAQEAAEEKSQEVSEENSQEISAKKIQWIKDFCRELTLSFQAIKKVHRGNYENYKNLQRLNDRSSLKLQPFAYAFIMKGYKLFGEDRLKMERLMEILEVIGFRDKLISTRADLSSRLSEIIKGFNGDLDELSKSFMKKFDSDSYWSLQRMEEILNLPVYENGSLVYLLMEYEKNLGYKGYNLDLDNVESPEKEHIAPQTPTGGDKIEAGYEVSEEGQYSEEFVKNYLNSIGNLLLISKSHNASIGNKKFSEKLATYKLNFLRQQMEIETFLDHVADNSDKKIEKWGSRQIEKRKEKIIEFALKRWSFDNFAKTK